MTTSPRRSPGEERLAATHRLQELLYQRAVTGFQAVTDLLMLDHEIEQLCKELRLELPNNGRWLSRDPEVWQGFFLGCTDISGNE